MAALIDQHGQPLRARMHNEGGPGGPSAAFSAADRFSQELASWLPALTSADSEVLPERDTITARSRDLTRNNGWAHGGIDRELDAVIGDGLRLSVKPDWRALGLSPEWAREWAQDVESEWRAYAEDPGCWCDGARHHDMGGLHRLAYRHLAVDGTALAVLLWREERPWATTVQLIDPDRLSNPQGAPDSRLLRGGVELDEDGAAMAYHIREGHPYEWLITDERQWIWERVPREMAWGRPLAIHVYDKERAGLTRGVGRLTSVLERLKMLDRYDKIELQAAVLNAILAAFIESPFDHEMMADAMSTVSPYQQARKEFHQHRDVRLGGVRIPTLFPGEKLSFQSAARPHNAFADFEGSVLRSIASGIGISYEQLSQDWSKTNYSSARAALLEVWRTLLRRRRSFAKSFCTPIYAAWLEEAIDRGIVRLPREAPDFWHPRAHAAYLRCRWIGPGRGWVDPVKEAQASVMRVDAGVSTLEAECAEQGLDWQEVAEQQAAEREFRARLGLPDPQLLPKEQERESDEPAEEREHRGGAAL